MAVRFIDIKYSLRISVFLARAETVALVNSKPSYFPVFNFQCLILKLNSNKPHSSAPSLLNINLTVSATFTVLHTSTVPVSFTFTFTVLFWQVLSYQSQIREYFVQILQNKIKHNLQRAHNNTASKQSWYYFTFQKNLIFQVLLYMSSVYFYYSLFISIYQKIKQNKYYGNSVYITKTFIRHKL